MCVRATSSCSDRAPSRRPRRASCAGPTRWHSSPASLRDGPYPGLMDRASHALFGWIAVLGAAISVVAILTLDAILGGQSHRPGRTLRMATISEYIYTAGGWAFLTGVLALALGSILLLAGLIRAGVVAPLSFGSILMSLWVIGLVGVAAFPKHNWEIGTCTSGSIHR